MSTPPRIAVVGAGPAGLTAAYELARTGAHVEVHEAGPAVGGLSRTLELWNQRVDLGPHRFHSQDARIQALWSEVLGDDWGQVRAHPGIFREEHILDYPLRLTDVVRKEGLLESGRCVLSFVREQARPRPEVRTFEDWLVRHFGPRVYARFFRDYNEKFFGVPLRELDAALAGPASKDASLVTTVLNAVRTQWDNARAGAVKEVTQDFAYPAHGTGMVYERMAEGVRARGGRVHLDSRVEALEVQGQRVTGLRTPLGTLPYDYVVSSAPLAPLVAQLPELPGNVREHLRRARDVLTFRSNVLVYLEVQSTELFPYSWLEMHTRSVRVGRITNFRNWVPQLHGEEASSILCLEYWCSHEEPLWSWPDAELVALAKRELAATGLDRGAPVGRGHVMRLPRCFPVYRPGYQDVLRPLREYLGGFERLGNIGRGGQFAYNSQDANWRMGLEAADQARAALGW
ncbi:FAD-dependent oxidoreductase [Corallococcus carmarthensis]|uniref:FAD-dependent oxidoreductase n=1 Tax=Corallococcus carmarthensis TaxID=2316728 RepID=A0A3A8K5Z2_9BACT|nr:FAD-dependent oxidoreductase [Corallococcus carmarthensis]NOK18059.1 FAD-dependent oxidoreductase [Corallococcus carmarthensis]RKH03573.1 FAD-dependent oxidoreductase [Corallococcus carmarthensis]